MSKIKILYLPGLFIHIEIEFVENIKGNEKDFFPSFFISQGPAIHNTPW